jgi:hypothetical protein
MKEHKIPSYDLGEVSMSDAFDVVFGINTLKKTHGDTLKASEWQDNKRTTNFDVNVEGIPWALRHVFCGHGIPVTVIQTLNPKENSWTVTNNINMHFVGSRFFNLTSWFEIHRESNHTYLTGCVTCNAKFLPPLNRIAESFMLSQCKKEIETYTKNVTDAFMAMKVKSHEL